jgi:hypothetical protein
MYVVARAVYEFGSLIWPFRSRHAVIMAASDTRPAHSRESYVAVVTTSKVTECRVSHSCGPSAGKSDVGRISRRSGHASQVPARSMEEIQPNTATDSSKPSRLAGSDSDSELTVQLFYRGNVSETDREC